MSSKTDIAAVVDRHGLAYPLRPRVTEHIGGCADANVPSGKKAPDIAGDVWKWTALDSDSKLIISYLVRL